MNQMIRRISDAAVLRQPRDIAPLDGKLYKPGSERLEW